MRVAAGERVGILFSGAILKKVGKSTLYVPQAQFREVKHLMSDTIQSSYVMQSIRTEKFVEFCCPTVFRRLHAPEPLNPIDFDLYVFSCLWMICLLMKLHNWVSIKVNCKNGSILPLPQSCQSYYNAFK